MKYEPDPIDTSHIELPPDLEKLTEQLARNVHEIWARQRLAEGWRPGPRRNDEKKEHPCLVPYDRLPETEKQYDRWTAGETLKVAIAMGFTIEKK